VKGNLPDEAACKGFEGFFLDFFSWRKPLCNISIEIFYFLSWNKKVTKKFKAPEKKLKFLSFRYSEESLLYYIITFISEDL
jgi:hypothetical protein